MKNWDNAKTDMLAETLIGISQKRAMKNFLRDLMTESEIAELGNRLAAAQMLTDKVPYTQIIEKTGLSSTTVARISKWLNAGMGGYQSVLHHHAVVKSGMSQSHRS
jgi:TrpR-related protein YerC/YecD